jgi:hypothetical protein
MLSTFTSTIEDTLAQVYQRLCFQPFLTVYLHGPAIGAYGFWQGRHLAEICSQLTSVSAPFWYRHSDECLALITQRAESYVVFFLFSLYLIVMLKILWLCFYKCYSSVEKRLF